MVLTNPIGTVVMEKKFPDPTKRPIQGVGKAGQCTWSEADDAASRVWIQENLQDPKGEEEKVTALLSPCPEGSQG